MLDSVASTIVECCAWGKEPDCQKALTVRASAENGSITPATTTFTVLPPEARLILGKSTLSFGDTTLATVEVRYPGSEWMERPYDWRTNFGIVQADTFGHLYLIDSSQTGSYINAWESNVIYYAHPQTETDSVDVLIQVVSHEPGGGGDTRIELIDHPNANSLQLERATKAPQPKVVAGTGKGNPGPTSIRYNYTTHYGLARLVLKKNEILLGETKYYQARPDPNNDAGLIFVKMSQTSGWVAGGQPAQFTVTAEQPSSKLGVYYEFKDNDGLALAGDMIRIIGRYWKPDTTYKVRLSAISGVRAGNIVIEVKKPTRLLTPGQSPTYRLSRDVFDNEINIDDTCIVYGGRYGIPPQFLKGQMFKESRKKDFPGYTGFAPSYRYEPFNRYQQLSSAWTTDKLYADKLWFVDPKRTNNQMGLGKDVPIHQHVLDVDYPRSPRSVWDILYDNSELVNTGSGKEHRVYGKRLSTGKMVFPSEYEDVCRNYNEFLNANAGWIILRSSKSKEQIAREKMIEYLRDKWEGGAKNMVAQTRLASSYGLLQLTYDVAVRRAMYPSHNPSTSPEDFNVTTTNMSYSLEYMRQVLQRGLSLSVEQNGNWPGGFEHWFKDYVWPIWNTGRPFAGGSYANDVFANAQNFKPQSR